MRAKIIEIVIGLLVGGVLVALYSLSEDYMFLQLSISTPSNTQRYILRLLLGTPSVVVVVLSAWVFRLHSNNKKLQQDFKELINNKYSDAISAVAKYKSESLNTVAAIQEQVKKEPTLDKSQINILKLLYSQDHLTTEQVADSLGVQLQTATYHLKELESLYMIEWKRHSYNVGNMSWPSLRQYSAWNIRQPGRKYLHDNKIVT